MRKRKQLSYRKRKRIANMLRTDIFYQIAKRNMNIFFDYFLKQNQEIRHLFYKIQSNQNK